MADIPEDFPVPLHISSYCSAIFLPGDSQDSWQVSRYPPRIYTHTRDTLAIYSHPSSDEAPFVVPLNELVEIHSQKALLFGTLDFYGFNNSRGFQYKATHHKYVARFLRNVRSLWLSTYRLQKPIISLPASNQAEEYRCLRAAEAELERGEELYLCWLQSQITQKKAKLCGKVQIAPRTFLILTNRRVMTIATTGPYGVAIRYTSPGNLSNTAIERTIDGCELVLLIKNGQFWRFSFADEQMPLIASISALLDTARLATKSMVNGVP